MKNLMMKEDGGIVYAEQQVPADREQRSEALADVRLVCESLQELCANIRKSWPARYPMPEDLDALLKFQDYALARVRAGSLRRVAIACREG